MTPAAMIEVIASIVGIVLWSFIAFRGLPKIASLYRGEARTRSLTIVLLIWGTCIQLLIRALSDAGVLSHGLAENTGIVLRAAVVIAGLALLSTWPTAEEWAEREAEAASRYGTRRQT